MRFAALYIVESILLLLFAAFQINVGILTAVALPTLGCVAYVACRHAASTASVMLAAMLLSIAFVAEYQAVAFLAYPGLMKDVEPFSAYHVQLTSIQMAVVFVAHAMGFLVLRGAMRVVRLRGATGQP